MSDRNPLLVTEKTTIPHVKEHQYSTSAFRPESVTVMGFLVSRNQFSILSNEEEEVVSLGQANGGESLVNPRSTRAQRLQSMTRTEGLECNSTGNMQNILSSSREHHSCVHSLSVSVAEVLNSESVANFELGTHVYQNALYAHGVRDTSCIQMASECKRIRVAGQERSAGRPGNRPIGAREAACTPNACLGHYANCENIPAQSTGHNPCTLKPKIYQYTRDVKEDDRAKQQKNYTSQPTTRSSSRYAANKYALPAMVGLHPHEPPYFSGTGGDDVHIWTSIVDRWLETIQGKPSLQLTYIVSLLRGAAFELDSSYETRTGCLGN